MQGEASCVLGGAPTSAVHHPHTRLRSRCDTDHLLMSLSCEVMKHSRGGLWDSPESHKRPSTLVFIQYLCLEDTLKLSGVFVGAGGC